MSLQRRRVNKEEEDKVILTGSKNGKFSIKALYSALELGSTTLFPTSVFWNSWVPPKVGFFAVPPKVGFFAWEVTWTMVLTLDHLKKRV